MYRRLVEVGRVRFEHRKRVEGLQKLGEFALRTVSVYGFIEVQRVCF